MPRRDQPCEEGNVALLSADTGIGHFFLRTSRAWAFHLVRWAIPVLFLSAACHSPPIAIRPVDHRGQAIRLSNAAELMQRVLRANDGYGTLKTVHHAAIEIALGEDRSENRSFRAVLAIRRPGHFRLTILGPMGVKLIDLLYAAGQSKVLYLAFELRKTSRLPEILDSISADIAAIYRLDPQPVSGRCQMEESVALASGRAPLYELKEYSAGEISRQMTIFAATLAIARYEVVDRRGDIRTITYGDYETNGNLLIPRSIHLSKEGTTFYWLSIRVESVAIDQELDNNLFVAERSRR